MFCFVSFASGLMLVVIRMFDLFMLYFFAKLCHVVFYNAIDENFKLTANEVINLSCCFIQGKKHINVRVEN